MGQGKSLVGGQEWDLMGNWRMEQNHQNRLRVSGHPWRQIQSDPSEGFSVLSSHRLQPALTKKFVNRRLLENGEQAPFPGQWATTEGHSEQEKRKQVPASQHWCQTCQQHLLAWRFLMQNFGTFT